MKTSILCAAVAALFATPALAEPQTARGEMVLYEGADFEGARRVLDLSERRIRSDWAARSLAIHPGDRWLICARTHYRGACVVLDRSIRDIAQIGEAGRIGSARPVSEPSPVAAAAPSLVPHQPDRQPGT